MFCTQFDENRHDSFFFLFFPPDRNLCCRHSIKTLARVVAVGAERDVGCVGADDAAGGETTERQ